MPKYTFTVSGSQLIVSLVPVESDVQPTSMSYLAPSFKIGVGKINAYEYGQPKQSFLFTEIGEIDGVEPTDLQDAFDKLTTATANFNGGGAAPYKVYTALLTQSGTDAPVATVLENTLGFTPTLIRENIGKYSLQSSNMWTGTELVFIGNGDANVSPGSILFYNSVASDSENIVIETTPDIGGDYPSLFINKTPIEIRIYN